VIVKVCPPIEMVPVRWLIVSLADTE
jgi:hypothetical protein